MKLGSLCSGAGGLDLAVEQVFGAETVWHCEIDAAASKVLHHRWPGVPNHGDLTSMDDAWNWVEPVDIICAGWPCQPFSLAGKRKGADDDRAIWPHIAAAIRLVRPRIIVLENVTAVLGSELQRVANDLAAIGYDLRWTCLRASDVGAPHRRERLFVVADTEDNGLSGQKMVGHRIWTQPARHVGGSDAALSGDGPLIPTPRASDAGPRGGTTGWGMRNWVRDELLPTPNATPLSNSLNLTCSGDGRKTPNKLGWTISELLPTPRTSDTNGAGKHGDGGLDLRTAVIESLWDKYGPAIARWEQIAGPAPSPTELNRNGNPRLNSAFSEWMMGWPAGWVTNIDISRNDQLRIIGNGVVPQQATSALRWLLSLEVAA